VKVWSDSLEWEAAGVEAALGGWDELYPSLEAEDAFAGDLAEDVNVGEWEGLHLPYLDSEDVLAEDLAEDVSLWGVGETLRDALREDYTDASSEELADAVENVFDSMTPAESFNFAKALGQIEKGAAQALADPAVSQFAAAALPVAGAAVGTAFGGPAGTAIGSGVGNAAAKALSKAKPAVPSMTSPSRMPAPAAAAGSAAATKALVLTQQPQVLKSLLALALGEHGRKSVDGMQVGAVMNLLSTIFSQAAADADELAYARPDTESSFLEDAYAYESDPLAPAERADAMYSALLSAENAELAEVVEGW